MLIDQSLGYIVAYIGPLTTLLYFRGLVLHVCQFTCLCVYTHASSAVASWFLAVSSSSTARLAAAANSLSSLLAAAACHGEEAHIHAYMSPMRRSTSYIRRLLSTT